MECKLTATPVIRHAGMRVHGPVSEAPPCDRSAADDLLQRRVQFANQAAVSEIHAHRSAQVVRQTLLDQPRAEAAPRGRTRSRAAGFRPAQAETSWRVIVAIGPAIAPPADRHLALVVAQCTVF